MGMTGNQIKKYLESRKKKAVWIGNFVGNMKKR